MTQAATDTTGFLQGFAGIENRLASNGPDWLRTLRRDSRARFESRGLPTSRDEDWRGTSLSPLLAETFRPATNGSAPPGVPGAPYELGGHRLLFSGGQRDGDTGRPLPDGIWAGSLADAIETHPELLQRHLGASAGAIGPFGDLNGAFLEDGAVIVVSPGAEIAEPIEIVYAVGGAEPTAAHPRTLIVAGENSRACVVETYVGTPGAVYFTNAVTEIVVGDGARLDHTRVQLESERAFHLAGLYTRQGRDSRIDTRVIDLGGRLVRNEIRSVLAGEGAYGFLAGLYLTLDQQHVDNHTTLDHAVPNCGSRELFKGVLADRSRSVFTGRIIVREDAQKTDAKQSNPNLLLSPDALAHTRPQLEIYADDVKCTHGATVGRMNEDAVFYLRSRGIAQAQARRMLVRAFAGEVLQTVAVPRLREELERLVVQRLERTEGK